MTQVLLHTSVANCGSRTLAPIFDLGLTVQPWLTQTPQSVENQIESLDSAVHHQACIFKRLSTPRSIWYLACITVPNPSEPELRQSSNQDIERLSDFRLIHIKASIIHVDMRDRDEVAFKLTTESINTLVEHYERSHRLLARIDYGDVLTLDPNAPRDRVGVSRALPVWLSTKPVPGPDPLRFRGILSLPIMGVSALKVAGCITAMYSQRRQVGVGNHGRVVPIMSFSTQQRPILKTLAFVEVLHAYAEWTIKLFMNPDTTADVRRGLTPTFKALVVGLVSELLAQKYCLPQPVDRRSPLAMYERGVVDEIAASMAPIPSGHRSSEFNAAVPL
ncbi:hypothetical protein CABS03_15004 [Colletotrichum abscissum]